MIFKRLLFYCLPMIVFAACEQKPSTATAIYFMEQEAGIEPYPTRMIVNKDYLRIDDGEGSEDFILFDRKNHKVSSVVAEDKRIFEITRNPVTLQKPASLAWTQKYSSAAEVPAIAGIQPEQHDFFVNNQPCLHVVAAEGLLDDARAALIEYRRVMAGEHAANLGKTPGDMSDQCDTARLVFHATDDLAYGFPVAEWDEKGKKRLLVDYKENIEVRAHWFVIPPGYTSFSLH